MLLWIHSLSTMGYYHVLWLLKKEPRRGIYPMGNLILVESPRENSWGWGWEGFRTSVLSTPLNILLFLSPSNFITKYTPLQTKKALFLFEEWMEEEFPNFKRMQGKHQTPASNSSKQISQTDTPREGDPGSLPPFDKEGNIKVPLMKTTFSKPYPLYSHNQAKLAREELDFLWNVSPP